MKISLCTTCMNRIEYLKKTISINLNLIEDFNVENNDKFELSLCNYDSKDGLDDYVKNNFADLIESGILVYTKVDDKKYFHVAHAKNIAYRYSSGDVLINLDSDNHLTLEILNYYNEIFRQHNINEIYIRDSECIGLIGLSRNNFYRLGGYNEEMKGYGFEDLDLMQRIETYLHCKRIIMPDHFDYNNKCVLHQDYFEKIKNYNVNVNNAKEVVKENMDVNRFIMLKYLSRQIENPNEFNEIFFGKV